MNSYQVYKHKTKEIKGKVVQWTMWMIIIISQRGSIQYCFARPLAAQQDHPKVSVAHY